MAFLLPIFYLYYGAYRFGQGGINTNVFSQEIRPLINTIETGLGAAALSTTLGSVYAWIVSRTDVPGKRLLNAIPLLALTMPLLTKGFGWIFLFSPQIGIFNYAIMGLFHLSSPPFNIFGAGGIIFATGLGGTPLVYLIMKPALDSFDSSLEETSRVVGNSSFRTFTRVTLPGILPALASAFFLLLIDSMSLLDYALILGDPVRFSTLATEVDYYATGAIPPNFGYAATISVEYIILTLAFVTVYVWLTRRSFSFSVITGKASRETVNKLRKWRYPALAVCVTIFTFVFILPFAMLLFVSFAQNYTFIHGKIIATYSFANWIAAAKLPLMWTSFENSIVFAVAAGLLSTVIAFFLSYAFLKSRVRGARFFEYVGYLPFVIPGIVYGLALYWTFLFTGTGKILLPTVLPMVLAVTFIYLPKSVRMISTNMVQVSNELEESPRVNGAGWWRSTWKVMVPLVKGGLINSFLYIFV
ncbi:MAG: iron ABC transporter permease, partial [Thaumarchaeota archaeon]|nr:iron ABC transporter permease [Nitrososphaerota archaeon]